MKKLLYYFIFTITIHIKLLSLNNNIELYNLIKKSTNIIELIVVNKKSLVSKNNLIETDIYIDIINNYKGYFNENKIKIFGGCIDNQILHLNKIPTFEKGEHVILFITNDNDSIFNIITNGVSGKYTLGTNFIDDRELIRYIESFGGKKYKSIHNIKCELGCSHPIIKNNNKTRKKIINKRLPIIINPINNNKNLIGKDILAIDEWNKHGNFFKIISNKQEWGLNNGICDIVEFMTDDDIKNLFGIKWGNTLAFTVNNILDDEIKDSDIFINPNVSWCLSRKNIPFSPNIFGIELTIAHELGHVLGLKDDFNNFSIMNYAPRIYDDDYSLTYSDINKIKNLYYYDSLFKNQLGIYMYNFEYDSRKYNNSSVFYDNLENKININNFSLYSTNNGFNILNVKWNISKEYRSTYENINLGSSSFFIENEETLSDKLTLNNDVPNGEYFLYGEIYNSNIYDSKSNNFSWLRKKIIIERDINNYKEDIEINNIGANEKHINNDGGGCILK